MSTIDEILELAKPAENTIRICLRGDLVAEHQALEAELRSMADQPQSHLAAADPRAPIAEAILDLEAEMRAAERPFVFRALGQTKYRELLDQHPGEPTQKFNPATFPRALISACCIDPVMTPVDVDRLCDKLNEGTVEALFMAAYTVNEGVTRVPFSERASALTKRRTPSS